MYYYVGNVRENDALKDKYLDFKDAQDHAMQRKEFLVKQADDLKTSIERDAKKFWDLAAVTIKDMPLKPAAYTTDWCIHINPETGDIITYERSEGLPSFLKQLTGD